MKTIIEANYIHGIDASVIWEYTEDDNGQLIKEEIISYYRGLPNKNDTEYYSRPENRSIKCFYS